MSILVHVLRELGIDSAWALTMSIAVDAYQRGLLYVECDVHSRDRKDLSFLFVTNIFRHLFPRDLIFLLPQPDSKMIPVLMIKIRHVYTKGFGIVDNVKL